MADNTMPDDATPILKPVSNNNVEDSRAKSLPISFNDANDKQVTPKPYYNNRDTSKPNRPNVKSQPVVDHKCNKQSYIVSMRYTG
jgi:hypothetical protein